MDKVRFQAHQLVGFTDMTNMQEVIQAFTEAYGLEVVGIDTFVHDGMVGTANDPADMHVNIGEGTGWKDYKRVVIPSGDEADVEISPADATNDRIDLIAIKHDQRDTDEEVTAFKDPVTKVKYNDTVARKIEDFYEIIYVEGTPGAEPEAPAIPSDAMGLYTVAVGAGVTTITDSDLTRIAPSKPDILVGSHRTENPIDHPNGSIFDVHIASTAEINPVKISDEFYDSLKMLITYSFSNFALPVTTEYNYSVTTGYLDTVVCASLGVVKSFVWDEDGLLTDTVITTSAGTFTKTFTYDDEERLTETEGVLLLA
jgi:hypothetical protein